jgi:predicted DNA-binding transcriptional regulator AlpA
VNADEYLTSRELAAWLKVSVRTIDWWANEAPDGTGPKVTKVGKSRRYKVADVQEWIERTNRVVQ